jgi:hypothetical protein
MTASLEFPDRFSFQHRDFLCFAIQTEMLYTMEEKRGHSEFRKLMNPLEPFRGAWRGAGHLAIWIFRFV